MLVEDSPTPPAPRVGAPHALGGTGEVLGPAPSGCGWEGGRHIASASGPHRGWVKVPALHKASRSR